jgi:hypothetical protein
MMLGSILVGLLLLFFGRQLFWLFVGGIGFLAGLTFATDFLGGQSASMVLLIAIIAGVVGAILSLLLQKLAIGIGGFLAGAYALVTLADRMGKPEWAWMAVIVGGILGAVFTLVLFDWALIFLSSLSGAIVIAQNLPVDSTLAGIALLILFAIGFAVQAAQLRRPVPPTQATVADAGPR